MTQVNIPQGSSTDIFTFGFDKGLNRAVQNASTPSVYDTIEDRLAGTNLALGVMMAGVANTAIVADPTQGLWLGNEKFSLAPFRVNMAGEVNMTSATISGGISATSGTIGGWTISSTSLTSGSGSTTVGLDSAGTNPAIYAGSATPGSAPFRVTQAGALTATNATITGSITATSGTIGGFTISSTQLTATNFSVTSGAANTANLTVGTGSTAGGINSANASGDIVFWAGDTFANRATAAFRVTAGGALTATSATISGYVVAQIGTFGGDGSDGALSITSGTTTIDLANADIVTKNYTSISITSTGKLAFINPATTGTTIYLKSQGNVTVTSTATCIDASGMGAAGGTAGTGNTAGATDGGVGTTALGIADDVNHHGLGGVAGAGAGGVGGAIYSNLFIYTRTLATLSRRALFLAPGSGGGGGGGANASVSTGSNGGAGGRGGGALVIECAGALNFTTALGISVAGSAGSQGVDKSTSNNAGSSGGGGGGGAAGFCLILYKTLTSSSGTINTAGGAGGIGGTTTNGASLGNGTAQSGGGGAGAGCYGGAGGNGGAGLSSDNNGNPGSAAGGGRAGGGGGSGGNASGASTNVVRTGGTAGAAGASENVLVAKNVYFA